MWLILVCVVRSTLIFTSVDAGLLLESIHNIAY